MIIIDRQTLVFAWNELIDVIHVDNTHFVQLVVGVIFRGVAYRTDRIPNSLQGFDIRARGLSSVGFVDVAQWIPVTKA